MRKGLSLIAILVILVFHGNGQLIQGTIKKGSNADQFEIWLKPDFTNAAQYLFQIGLPIAFPVSASPQPTGITVALDPTFTSSFGNNYTATVNPVATATGGLEKYFTIQLVRGGAGASAAQNWTAGLEFKLLTGTFTYSSGSTTFQAKLADYQDGGSDGQGNFYTQSGNNDYYITSNSVGNFYASAGNSTVGGTATAGYAQLISGTLPVSLMEFTGYNDGNKNILNWKTASEINNKGFEIYSSTDGSHFQPLAFANSLALNGNSTSILNYRYEDLSPVGELEYYRLKQIDINGQFKWSTVLSIRTGKQAGLKIYPNPTVGQLSISFASSQKQDAILEVFDDNGRTVFSKVQSVNAGSNAFDLDVSKLAKGKYMLKLQTKTESTITNFIKQ